MHRSEITIELGAIRHNARRLLETLDGAELWAVVKANGYGHGATDVARAALEAGASALCVVTVAEALDLRRELPEARLIVMCPTDELAEAREARVELVISGGDEIPDDVPVHLKLNTGMGRWGLAELPQPPANIVGGSSLSCLTVMRAMSSQAITVTVCVPSWARMAKMPNCPRETSWA